MVAFDRHVREAGPLQQQAQLVLEVEVDVQHVIFLRLERAVAPLLGVHLVRDALLERIHVDDARAKAELRAV